MTMKKILIALLAVTVFWQANAAEATWLTDLPAAEAQAKAENKIVLMDFTGSDWCRLDASCSKRKCSIRPEFQTYAAKNVVLVKVGFSRTKKSSPKN